VSATMKLRKFAHVDPMLLMAVVGLLALGTVMIFSASSLAAADHFGDSAYYLKRHLTWTLLGGVLFCVVFLINHRVLRSLALPGLIGIGVLLLITAVTSLGVEAKHATRWLSLGGFTFQPSEFAKPIIVIYVARYIAKKGTDLGDLKRGLLPLLLTVGAVLVLILKQPDFGTAVALAAVVFIMLFVGQARWTHLVGLAGMAAVGGYFLIHGAVYRQRRLLAFLDPWKDPRGSGFQIIQSFIAFQQGGLQGQGLGDGTQKLLYLPEAHTDFIFSVIAEELGLLGCLLVITLFGVIVVQGLRLAIRIQDTFASQVALGLTALIGIQGLLNMAVVMSLVPTKGLTLPLVSYGGSSLIATLLSVAVLLSLSSTVAMSTSMAKKRVS
jgi:cell division protein FtsW